ncbi:Transcriptional regulator [Lachnellula suecica]|uniref:Transcriptional regulator n=1 Tax=Lachnellula suecica TaxID=602035 RepID=A0A8T9CJY3_9HELO|nr:Transcriptional regulator [Lachnellula suecica]
MFDFLYRLFGRGQRIRQMDHIETDEVFPLHFLDRGTFIRKLVMSYTFQYDDVLDPQMLHDSLAKLLAIGGWRKLGGRLRLNANGNIELHTPRTFTAERPPVMFTHLNFDLPIGDHPLASRLPKMAEGISSIHKGYDRFNSLTLPRTLPDDIHHYLTTDVPLTSLHIVSFTDATLVTISRPHTVTDAMGMAVLIKAWSDVLAGRLDRVPTLHGTKDDVLESVGTASDKNAQVPFVLQDKHMKGWTMLVFVIRFTWDKLTNPRIQPRTVALPASFVSQLRQNAEREISSNAKPNTPTFFSDGDLLMAWFCRFIALSRSVDKPASISYAFDLRGRLDGTIIPGDSYVQNLALTCFTWLPTPIGSIGEIALSIRQTIARQTTPSQARSLMKLTKDTSEITRHSPLFGTSNAMFMGASNWTKIGLREAANFAPAVISSTYKTTAPGAPPVSVTRPGSCVSYWGGPVGKSTKIFRDFFFIYGKDNSGTYWIEGYLRPETWNLIREELEQEV